MARAPIVLFIGQIFPEPVSSAAGWRTLALIGDFRAAGYEAVVAAPSDKNGFADALEARGVRTHAVYPNDPAFDSFVAELRPDVAILDRFMIEEQFGWRIREHSPGTMIVLDTIDLHFLRRGRGEWLDRGRKAGRESEATAEILADAPEVFAACKGSDDALREIAALHRADVSLVISPYEAALLGREFSVPAEKLLTLPFSYESPPVSTRDAREEFPASSGERFSVSSRENFAMIGNFRHGPNLDSVRWTVREIWPLIRERLPRAELHLYGAYPPKEVMELKLPGVRALGPCADAVPTLARYRALLAPLRYGAGLKGKIADAWAAGTPVVTTPIGAEGMEVRPGHFAGAVARTPAELASAAARVHEEAEYARELAVSGRKSLESLFDPRRNAEALLGRIGQIRRDLEGHRARDFVGRMLGHHAMKSTTYFSLWIQEKERAKKERAK